MGVRETLNKNQPLAVAATVVLLLAAVAWIAYNLQPSRGAGIATEDFFTVDEGRTWFKASVANIPPFQHEGKTACGVKLYTCDGGKTVFAGLLQRYTEGARATLVKAAEAAGDDVDAGDIPFSDPGITLGGIEYKKPMSDSPWVGSGDRRAFSEVTTIQCKEPGGVLDSVLP